MMLKHSLCILFGVGLLCMSSCRPRKAMESIGGDSAGLSATDSLMRVQADAFLTNMPVGLQDSQALAIRQAINGNCSALDAVRNARNTPPLLSANVSVRMLTPSLRLYEPLTHESRCLPLLIYLHGGGWTFGSLNSCGRFCNAMAASGRMKVLAVDYRLAPEHPFPAGLDDCVEAICYAREHAACLGIDPERISVGGDSSGGNLAIASALHPSCGGLVYSLLLFYPVTKAYNDGSRSWERYGHGFGLDAGIMEDFNRAYVGSADPMDVQISVGLCTDEMLRRLPRTLLIAAGRDILCDQGREFAQRVGAKVTRIEFPEAVHLFITVPGQDKAFEEAVRKAVDYLDNSPVDVCEE